MLIKVKAERCRFIIPLPLMLGFMFSGLAKKFIKDETMGDIANISDSQLRFAIKKMRKALRQSKKLMKGLPIIDVKESGGTEIKIFL